MGKRIAIAVIALLAAAGAVALLVSQPVDPEGQAVGQGSGGDRVWQRLSAYEGTLLKSWRGAFDNVQTDPMDVLDAFNEVAFATTGPAGFWRRTVPARWLGCSFEAASAPCRALSAAGEEFARWDDLQARISALEPHQARRFLARNSRDMLAYLDRYVPAKATAPAMRETPFFADRLAEALAAGQGAPSMDGDL